MSYSLAFSTAPQQYEDGGSREHVIMHYSNIGVNIAVDLGPAETAEKAAELVMPGWLDAVKAAKAAESELNKRGFKVIEGGNTAEAIKHLDYGKGATANRGRVKR